jgi:hypothetical protein
VTASTVLRPAGSPAVLGATATWSAPARWVRGDPRRDLNRAADGGHLRGHVIGYRAREFLTPRTAGPRPVNERAVSEPGEHLVVAGRPDVRGELARELRQTCLVGVKRGRDPDCKSRPAPSAGGGRFLIDPRPDLGDVLGRDEVEDDLVGAACRDSCHRRSERRHCDRCAGLGAAEFEAVCAHVRAVDVGALAVEDRAQRGHGLVHLRRELGPRPVVPGSDDRRA